MPLTGAAVRPVTPSSNAFKMELVMNPIEVYETQCPWCSSPLLLEIDCSAGVQSYTEDCSVCCQPVVVTVGFGVAEEPSLIVDCARDD